MNSIGVLGDLCRETEWIWQRMKCVSRSIASCQHPRLKQRLLEEINIYRNRSLNVKKPTELRPDAIITLVDAPMIVEGVALSRSEKALGIIWMY